jgi:hypothetical protein
MRPTFKLVSRTEPRIQGAAEQQAGLTATNNFSKLASGACHCGPGRDASGGYICVTCARAARHFRQVQQRNAERRRGHW